MIKVSCETIIKNNIQTTDFKSFGYGKKTIWTITRVVLFLYWDWNGLWNDSCCHHECAFLYGKTQNSRVFFDFLIFVIFFYSFLRQLFIFTIKVKLILMINFTNLKIVWYQKSGSGHWVQSFFYSCNTPPNSFLK